MSDFSCNSCFVHLNIFSESAVSSTYSESYLTACKHIFCDKCLRRMGSNCRLCRRSLRSIPINRNMPLKFRVLFVPLQNALNTVNNVIRFQMSQQNGYIKHFARKYDKSKDNFAYLERKIQHMRGVNQSKKEWVNNLKFIINKTIAVK